MALRATPTVVLEVHRQGQPAQQQPTLQPGHRLTTAAASRSQGISAKPALTAAASRAMALDCVVGTIGIGVELVDPTTTGRAFDAPRRDRALTWPNSRVC
jgi:hypothetical protein